MAQVPESRIVAAQYSPNQTHVWYPPMGSNREMRIRRDGRYSDDDFICWPQRYSENYPHHPFIPRCPPPYDPTRIMWHTPSSATFIPSAPGVLGRVGRLDPLVTNTLPAAVDTLKNRHKQYDNRTSGKSCLPLVIELNNILTRLDVLPGTIRQVHFAVVHLQRLFLELTAFLDYAYVYLPIMRGIGPPATATANVVGTFIASESGPLVQQFVRAGIPVWITATSTLLPVIRIDALVEPRRPHQHTEQTKLTLYTFFLFSPLT